jgi:peptidyl-prolyl cis-trans isomerase A (cyclophilin A)
MKRSFLRWTSALCLSLASAMVLTPSWGQAANPRVRMVTNLGDIEIELQADKAPKTVANFLQYVKDKHYNDTIFHRVIPNFMVQGGGFDAKFKQKPTRAPIQHEGRAATAAGLKNQIGTVAMARTGDPHSATSQFFINVVNNAFLDPSDQSYGYTVFGIVTSGMDVVQKIRNTPTGAGGPLPSDVPQTPIVIQSITLIP